MARVNHEEFMQILHLIKDSILFKDKYKQQFPISVQLALTLYRFGVYGQAASLRNVAGLFGMGDGSTIHRITNRVIDVRRPVFILTFGHFMSSTPI